jgi:hypothetical protein
MAAPKAKRMVDREKVRKMRRGRNERRSCDTMKEKRIGRAEAKAIVLSYAFCREGGGTTRSTELRA